MTFFLITIIMAFIALYGNKVKEHGDSRRVEIKVKYQPDNRLKLVARESNLVDGEEYFVHYKETNSFFNNPPMKAKIKREVNLYRVEWIDGQNAYVNFEDVYIYLS